MGFDIVAFGDMVVDFTPYLDANSYIRNFGGAPANVCLAAVRTGASAAFCGMVGDDMFGRFLTQTLEENSIDASGVRYTAEAITTMTFIQLTPGGERDFVFARKPGADMFFSDEHIDHDLIAAAGVFHFCVLALSTPTLKQATHRMIDIARENEAMVSFDMNYRQDVWGNPENALREIVSILDRVDVLKVSAEEAVMITRESNLNRAIERLCADKSRWLTIITCGESGAYAAYSGKVFHSAGYHVKAVDTTGAGDAFWGTFLSELLHSTRGRLREATEENLLQAMRYANAAGALTVTKKGVLESIPTRAEICSFLENQNNRS